MTTRIPRISLEQWAVLKAVVDEGGFAQAAEALNKSQSSVSYALKNMQEQLPVELMTLRGRRAALSPTGETLLRRARLLLDDALSLEQLAAKLAGGWESEIRLAVDAAFPPGLLARAFEGFAQESSSCCVQLKETVLSGAQEALLNHDVDLVITQRPPPGFLGKRLLDVEFVVVAAPSHPLHRLERTLTAQDLRAHRQLVVRDSGLKRSQNVGWLGAERRWTVSHLDTSIRFVTQGLGFAWLPKPHIAHALENGALKPLSLEQGAIRHEELFLVFADRDNAGPGALALAEALEGSCRAGAASSNL